MAPLLGLNQKVYCVLTFNILHYVFFLPVDMIVDSFYLRFLIVLVERSTSTYN
jgi:hypothetical protein